MDALVIPVLFIIIGVITALLAKRKGYNFLVWVFAGAPIGLVVLAFLKNAKKVEIEEKKRSVIKRGNIIGVVVAICSVVYTIMFITGTK